MEMLKRKIGMDEGFTVDAVNKAGGWAIFWKKEVKVLQMVPIAFTMEIQILEKDSNTTWWCVGIYASTNAKIRKEEWKVLKRRKVLWGPKWILVGDFNDILSMKEKWGGRHREEWTFNFKDFVEKNDLLDLGWEGLPWTWSNHGGGEVEIKERLDRALSNFQWHQHFPNAKLNHIQSYASYHPFFS